MKVVMRQDAGPTNSPSQKLEKVGFKDGGSQVHVIWFQASCPHYIRIPLISRLSGCILLLLLLFLHRLLLLSLYLPLSLYLLICVYISLKI